MCIRDRFYFLYIIFLLLFFFFFFVLSGVCHQTTHIGAYTYRFRLSVSIPLFLCLPVLLPACLSAPVCLFGDTTPRKRDALNRYKLFIKYPQGLRLTFDRIKERLEDSDSSVVSCAVNVICELADKNPKNYLAMAPQFFRLLTTSSNNWMLIKVVVYEYCLLYTSPSPRDKRQSRMPSSA